MCIRDRYRIDKREVIESGYDSILYALRKREREILNMRRALEYERNRPPVKNWYMLKNTQFNEELNKNRKCCDVMIRCYCSPKIMGSNTWSASKLKIFTNLCTHTRTTH
eukprot:TRINITY_DN7956_c0_g1_i4.p1 TRINITY_DN7956_c0_g1~~TRINITY_DN7956_c0_g1_i4.p1  ORF type:complete len:109 (+),score=16.27 TRINITY_DN7956_c0_g1_i4:118-444(+)